MIRKNFNFGWELMTDRRSSLGLMAKNCKTVPVAIPHDGMIHETRTPDTPNQSQTGFCPGKQYVYIKKIQAPEEWKNSTVILEFEGVYQTAMVYLNGHLCAHNLHGYSNFYVVLDPHLKYGEENEIKVIADNSAMSNSRWYSGSGIYRDVRLLQGEKIHVPADGVKIRTISASKELAALEVKIQLRNLEYSKSVVHVTAEISRNGEVAGRERTKITMFQNAMETIYQNIYIANPALWDCDSPELYDVTVSVECDGEILDVTEDRIGIRTMSLDPVHGLMINGRSVKLRGACIHHDNGIIGAATFERAEERRICQLKEAGFNSIRSCHHPASKAMLNACDKYGVLVMDELSDVWTYHKNPHDFALHFTDCWEKEVERMVDKDYNHPSVIMYSAGNEIPEIGLDSGARMKRQICNLFHRLDASRYTTDGMNGSMSITYGCGMDMLMKDIFSDSLEELEGANALNAMMSLNKGEKADEFARHPYVTEALEESSESADIIGLNYLTGRYLMEKELHPNKTLVGAETYPADIVRLWGLVKRNPYILGDFTWAGYDYLGEAGCGIFHYDDKMNFGNYYPERAAYIGDLDLIGYRRPISYFREIVYGLRREPYIAVERVDKYGLECSKTEWMFKDNLASWTWPGCEGRPAKVDVYCNSEEVELFLNGKSFGRKPAGEENNFTAAYELDYEPGILSAISYSGGKETGSFTLETSGNNLRIKAKADRTVLAADGEDLSFITVRLEDENGIENLFETRKIRINIEGDATLQGFGNADPQSTGSYDDKEWETYDGYVMAVIRAGKRPGRINVVFSSEGCPDELVEIETKE